MARIGTRKGVFLLGSGTPVDHSNAVSKVVVTSGESESDFTSFWDASQGGARDYKVALTLAQDLDTASLFAHTVKSVGSDLPFEWWPNGRPGGASPTPTAAQPKVSGTVTIQEPDGDWIGGEADKSNTAVMTTEVEWPCTARPTITPALT